MPFIDSGSVRYFSFDLFNDAGVLNAVFTRRGGISPAPWASLNIGATVGDAGERVQENRRLALAAVGREPSFVYEAWQVHGARAISAAGPRAPGSEYQKADILLTATRDCALLMRFADCVPVFLYDPVSDVVGLVHTGWLGTVRQAVRAAVRAMENRYGTRPAELLAGIGPSIGPDHYEVGENVISAVRRSFGETARTVLPARDGSVHFDLWQANRLLLEQAGVRHIEVAELCTACHLEDWYSHRGENGHTGRFGALIGLM